MSTSTYIIAEAGVNHNGSTDRALEMVRVAARCGANAVKFQTFRVWELVSERAPMAVYQKKNTGSSVSQADMLRPLELPHDAHFVLRDACAECGIDFLSTPFDMPSLEFLVQRMGASTLKIGSGNMTDGPLLLAAAQAGCEVILSTGMADMPEVERALGVLAFGYRSADVPRGAVDFERLDGLEGRVTLLHCTTQYPTSPEEINLRAMQTLGRHFSLPVGFSDHSEGISIGLAAVALGATVLEKHFTLSRELPGPDHKASLEPDELAALVEGARAIETAFGTGEKVCQASEAPNRAVARKSLVAARAIEAGAVIEAADLTTRRPGDGISGLEYWDVVGRRASRGYAAGEAIGERVP
ncbi:MAG: N-acetylneuraminate synthase [Rhodothermales bacterium]|nr:N-acetylneuraminate synthase [Rhodothermales bacterium]MBO6781042.1 N-acetylneuraminate synthase [Rhodothermales bacterium]